MLYNRSFEDAAQWIFVSTTLLLVLMPSIPHACYTGIQIKLTGFQIVDIPRNMNSNVEGLHIYNTNISILNLTATGDYPAMCWLEIVSSPVKIIITPHPPQVVALKTFRLGAGNFPTAPDLGIVLAQQLKYLWFRGIGLVSIPDNYFKNFTSLVSLSLEQNPISNLNANNMVELRHLQTLNLANTHISPLPPLHLWLHNLKQLGVAHTNMTTLSASMLANLPKLQKLDLSQNELSSIPTQDHFVNLKNMVYIKLKGNPLRCDTHLCWVKVIAATMCQYDTGPLTAWPQGLICCPSTNSCGFRLRSSPNLLCSEPTPWSVGWQQWIPPPNGQRAG